MRLLGMGFFLFLFLTSPARAQLSPDRPGMGNGTSVMAPQRFQLEGGYGFATSGAAASSHDVGQLLIRYGVASWLEMRGGLGSYVVHKAPLENGYSGTTLGGKVALWRSKSISVSALSTWGLPTGTGTYDGSDAWQAVTLAFDASVVGPVSFSANLGHTVSYGGNGSGQTMVTVTWGLGLSDAISVGLGYAGFYAGGPDQNYVEGTATYLADENTQLDVSWAYQVDGFGDELQLGVGVARRF